MAAIIIEKMQMMLYKMCQTKSCWNDLSDNQAKLRMEKEQYLKFILVKIMIHLNANQKKGISSKIPLWN